MKYTNVPPGFFVDEGNGKLYCCKCGWPYAETFEGIHTPCWDAFDWKRIAELVAGKQDK